MRRALVFWGGCISGLLAPALAAAVTLEITADRFERAIEPGAKIPGTLSARLTGPDLNTNGVLDPDEIDQARISGNLGQALFDIVLGTGPDGAATRGTVLLKPTPGLEKLFSAKDGFLVVLKHESTKDLVTVVLTEAQVGLVQQSPGTPLLAAVSPATASSGVSAVPLPGSAGLLLTALGVLGLASGLVRRQALGRVTALLPIRLRRRRRDQRTVLG